MYDIEDIPNQFNFEIERDVVEEEKEQLDNVGKEEEYSVSGFSDLSDDDINVDRKSVV